MLGSPIGITNTHSFGAVRDAPYRGRSLVAPTSASSGACRSSARPWTGSLNDQRFSRASPSTCSGARFGARRRRERGQRRRRHRHGSAMASRVQLHGLPVLPGRGRRLRRVPRPGEPRDVERLRVNGDPGSERPFPSQRSQTRMPLTRKAPTRSSRSWRRNAALLPVQCERLAQRAALGIARVGGVGEHSSGDLFLAFATGNRGLPSVIYGCARSADHPGWQMLANTDYARLPRWSSRRPMAIVFSAPPRVDGREGATAYELPLSHRLHPLAAAS